jgi:hypothetical protein
MFGALQLKHIQIQKGIKSKTSKAQTMFQDGDCDKCCLSYDKKS